MEDLLEKYRKNEHLQVPEGYFESLPDEVMAQIKLGEIREKSLQAEEKLVPAGYFDALPDEVMAQISLGEIREKSLQAEEKLVPAGYFDALPDEVMAQISGENHRLFFRPQWTKIASIAACGLIVLGIGLFAGLHFTQNDTSSQLAHQSPVKIIKKIIVKRAPQTEETLLAAAEIPAEMQKNTSARRQQAAKIIVDNDLVAIGDFEEEDLNSIDYELLEMFSDDYALADYWEL